jgi:hypothetical protein
VFLLRASHKNLKQQALAVIGYWRMKTETLHKALAEIGRIGGMAGTGKAKRRSKSFYRRLSRLGVKERERLARL